MKNTALSIVFYLFSTICFSLECKLNDLPEHWNAAQDVVFGTIISGKANVQNDVLTQIDFKFEIITALKGERSEILDLSYFAYEGTAPEISLGNTYILFLRGSNNLGPCDKLISLEGFARSEKQLNFIPKREDVWFASEVEQLLIWSKRDPNKTQKIDAKKQKPGAI